MNIKQNGYAMASVAPKIIWDVKMLRSSCDMMTLGPMYKKLMQKRKMLTKIKLLRIDLNRQRSRGVLVLVDLTPFFETFSTS